MSSATPGVLGPLRLPGFRALVGTYVVNELGNWLGEIALAILVFDQTGSPVATAALFLAMQFLPAFLAPVLVSRFESLPANRSLPILYGLEAVAFTVLALLAQEFIFVAVIAVAAIDGALAASARALTRASVGAILTSPGMLREGNAVLNIGFTACAALGPLFGGLVVAGAGVEAALWADAISFGIVAVVIAGAKGIPRIELEAEKIMQRLRDGYRYVRERPALARLLTAESAAFVFFYAAIPIEVVFAKETLDAGDAGYGLLLSSWGVGMVAGGLVFAMLRGFTLRVLLGVSTLAIGLAYLGMAAAPTLARRLRRRRGRRGRQRDAVGGDGQRGPGADRPALPGPRDGDDGVDLVGDARASGSSSAARWRRSSHRARASRSRASACCWCSSPRRSPSTGWGGAATSRRRGGWTTCPRHRSRASTPRGCRRGRRCRSAAA